MMSAAQWGGGTNVIAQPFTSSFSGDGDDDDFDFDDVGEDDYVGEDDKRQSRWFQCYRYESVKSKQARKP